MKRGAPAGRSGKGTPYALRWASIRWFIGGSGQREPLAMIPMSGSV